MFLIESEKKLWVQCPVTVCIQAPINKLTGMSANLVEIDKIFSDLNRQLNNKSFKNEYGLLEDVALFFEQKNMINESLIEVHLQHKDSKWGIRYKPIKEFYLQRKMWSEEKSAANSADESLKESLIQKEFVSVKPFSLDELGQIPLRKEVLFKEAYQIQKIYEDTP